MIIICGGLLLLPRLEGEQLWEETTLELGESLRDDVSSYVSGNSFIMKHTFIDNSGVNYTKVGDYTVRAVSPFKEYDYKVHIRDTTPPELDIGDGWKNVLSTEEEYDPEVIGIKASDLGGIAFLKYFIDGKETDKLKFSKVSRPELVIRATDGNANSTEKKVRLIVDTPPRFYGVHDQYLLRGSRAEELDPVFACDDVDGGLTAKIRTDISGVSFNNIGDYEIKYEVEDSYGLKTDAEAKLHIVSSQQRVDEHRDDCSISSNDLACAVEEGFFVSEPLSVPDRDKVIEECAPSLVNLFVERADGSTSSGSAFVYRVESDYVYLVSVYHVTSAFENGPLWITFYDGTRIRTAIRSIRLSAGNEASLFRIPVRIIPYHILVRLKEVATEEDIYDQVKEGTPLLEYCKNWRAGEEPEMAMDVNVISMQLTDIQKRYVDAGSYFTTTRRSVSGMSGTAVFDLRGVLAGICSKTMFPVSGEDPVFSDGCDLVLRVDGLDTLFDRSSELAK